MTKPFNTNYRKIKLPKSRHEAEEFSSKMGLIFCGDCRAVFYKKSWHHSTINLKSVKESSAVNFVLCPACQMIKNHQFEGQIIIQNIPLAEMGELVNLIKGYCDRAYQKDPLDRLITIKRTGDSLAVTTTENQLANKLAKKIKDAFNKVKTKTSFQKAPGDLARVVVEFLEK